VNPQDGSNADNLFPLAKISSCPFFQMSFGGLQIYFRQKISLKQEIICVTILKIVALKKIPFCRGNHNIPFSRGLSPLGKREAGFNSSILFLAISTHAFSWEAVMNSEPLWDHEDFQRCVAFHGHTCPGIAIGFQAARILLKRLGIHRSIDEELIAIVETDACGADAIQVLTGCTFGKGNLVSKNYGKHAFTLADRAKGIAVRVSLRAEIMKPNPDHFPLLDRIRNGQASPEEKARANQIHQERILKILGTPPDELFTVEEMKADLPPKATIMESAPCDRCGEPTKVDLLFEVDGQKICIPCSEKKPGASPGP
jgi:formylmethanofuran dehydrogenase subunit E